jgi:Bacterial regulatory protein, Fis family
MENAKLIDQVADLMLDAGCDHWEAASLHRAALLRRALERTDGNVCRAAVLLRMHRNSFMRSLAELGMRELPRELKDRRQEERRQNQLRLWNESQRMQPGTIQSVSGLQKFA